MANLPTGPKGSVVGSFTDGMEKNNHKQGRDGAQTLKKPGPSAGKTMGTSSNSGGIIKGTNPSNGQ